MNARWKRNTVVATMAVLVCAAVGLNGVRRSLEEKLYYMTSEKLLTVLILAVAAGILGISGFVVLSSVCGTYYVIRNRLKSKIE